MIKNIKVVSGIIIILLTFTVLQMVTGSLFYSAVNNDRNNFQNANLLNFQQEQLGDSFQTLVKISAIRRRLRQSTNYWRPPRPRLAKRKNISHSTKARRV